MSTKIDDLDITKIDEKWLLNFVFSAFKNYDENITSLKILAKLGISIHDQTSQLKNKLLINKFNLLLNNLQEQGLLVLKSNNHDTLGIKEKAYKAL